VLEVKPRPRPRPDRSGPQTGMSIAEAARRTGVSVHTLMEAHRVDVTAKFAELHESLKLIDHKIDVYRGRLASGDADQIMGA
jgi:hypothetical protein